MQPKGRSKSGNAATRQPMISSFFSQPSRTPSAPDGGHRSSSPIDLTLSGDEAPPPAKKRKITHALKRDVTPPSSLQPQGGSTSSQWRYEPSQSPERRPVDPEVQKRREQFAKRLLVKETSSVDVGRKTDDEDTPHSRGDDAGSSGDESDDKFKQLQKLFTQKTDPKKKGKAKAAPAKRSKKQVEIGPSGEPYTALELQVKRLKEKHEGVLLMIEVGYKYKFFGEDAKVAAKELGIVAYPDRNFTVASIPVHRRDIHLRKLLSRGHKVGIVGQTETAALKKAGDNRNAPFERELTHLYTAVTYVDDLDSADDIDANDTPWLMCLVEQLRGGMGADERVSFGMIVICPSTGDVVWDEFEDGHMRTELETRMVHCKPSELLLAEQSLTKPTERMLKHFAGSATTEHSIRIERYKTRMSYTDAFDFVSDFYTRKTNSGKASASKLMAEVTDFPKQVTIALAQCIEYLSAFRIADALLATNFFAKFTTRAHMLLNGNTLTNLEIYQNDTNFTKKGSLMWILDKTTTKFGSRLLHNWVGRPLVDMNVLQERIDAVEEIISTSSQHLHSLRPVLKGLPDLSKGLCRIQYGKCTPKELSVLLSAFNRISMAFPRFQSPAAVGFKSPLLNGIVYTLPLLREPIQELIDTIVLKKAAVGNKAGMWSDPERYPEIADADGAAALVAKELDDQLKIIRGQLKKPALQWTTVLGDEYLIEISRSEDMSKIPHTWLMHSSSSAQYEESAQYYTPIVKEKLALRDQFLETRDAAANKAFLSFLNDIAQTHYALLRDAVHKLATADCLLSLALVALRNNYVKPQFVARGAEGEEDVLEIVDGRHPMVEALRADPFVPNSVALGGGEPRSKVITGPNMGGKSSAVRMIALIAIMAQIGSYVPAVAARLSMLDGVLTRMGASDELARGRSTFMVEMSETSDILLHATSRSLVILDELGRGTSTFDGMAIAHAVLHHLVTTTRAKTLFITHYPHVAAELAARLPDDIENLHMGFAEETRINGTRDITFLYRLEHGLAAESFGIECARLAGIPEDVLEPAVEHAERMRKLVEERARQSRARKALKLLATCSRGSGLEAMAAMEELQTVMYLAKLRLDSATVVDLT
ncbi:DNA mismatch repair protein MSH3 [Gloeopeniophorella convolvens]|nr:DNA mismatch repair protein MSH3 [Gloeopeniophorella convolvens]